MFNERNSDDHTSKARQGFYHTIQTGGFLNTDNSPTIIFCDTSSQGEHAGPDIEHRYDGPDIKIEVVGMRYKIIESENVDTVQDEVVEHLIEGWKPLGGIALSVFKDSADDVKYWYAQAMMAEYTNDSD